jgi:hypothetical protein
MTRGKTAHLAKALSLEVVRYQLLHRERCGGVFRESGQSILDFGIVGQDVMQKMNRIETDKIEELEE